jgi:hypothetical protein
MHIRWYVRFMLPSRSQIYVLSSVPGDVAASKRCGLLKVCFILSSSNVSVVNERFTLLLRVLLPVLLCTRYFVSSLNNP